MTEPTEPPLVDLPDLTIVQDAATKEQLLRIKGSLVMPIGSRILLGSADVQRHGTPVDGIVTDVLLWGASGSPTVVLEVLQVAPGELADRP